MSEAQEMSEKVVTRGLLGEFGVVAVLQALSLSRQYTSVELFDDNGMLAGRVTLKSGMVLGAFVPQGSLKGTEAFRDIVSRNLRSFQVERLPPPHEYPTPIGRLSAQLLAAKGGSRRPPALAPAPEPAREPVSEAKLTRSNGRGFSPRVVPPVRDVPAARAQNGSNGAVSAPRSPSVPNHHSHVRTERPSVPVTGGPPIIAVASPKGGSGKTTMSLNLAVSLAQSGLSIVLVDADPNGDILSAISARSRATTGLYEAVAGDVDASQLLMNTAIPNLKVVPAMGPNVPHGVAERLADSTMTSLVLQGLRGGADAVIVDTPAGMFGMTAQLLEVCTHVIGVLQAESIAKRSFPMFQKGLNALAYRPNVLGVVLNMFQRSHGASLGVLMDAGMDMPESWLFQTTIPRSEVFLDATEAGCPVRFADSDAASVVSLLFDTLASEVKERLELVHSARPQLQGSFLL